MFFLILILVLFSQKSFADSHDFYADYGLYESNFSWNKSPTIYLCKNNDIKIKDVKTGRDFWNDISREDVLGNITNDIPN